MARLAQYWVADISAALRVGIKNYAQAEICKTRLTLAAAA